MDAGGGGGTPEGQSAARFDLTRGKISRFSLDGLVNMLTDAGMDVDV
ncbi:MAG: hypothetical protein R2724_27275 [Bryobacterales bacterium]